MSEEEKKAIEELKSFINDKDCIYWIGKNGEEAVKIILNLIEKQSKEIEELKDTRSIFNMGRRSYKNEIESKIREIIEGDYTDLGKILEIEKLLEE